MEAIITKLLPNLYTIYDFSTNKSIEAKATALLRHKKISPKVGDKVEYEMMNDEFAYIKEIKKRKNDLIRPNMANIDIAFVLTSVYEPKLNLNLLDRFLVILEFNDITPILIFTKYDILPEEEQENVNSKIDYYRSIGYNVIISNTDKDVKDKIAELSKDKICVFTGQSGVGKSTLLNRFDEKLNISTNEISKALGRGKHTTRHTELIKFLSGWIADTPGFGLIEFRGMTKTDIAHSFIEFFELSKKCKYSGCLHLNEPNCCVKENVENKNIMIDRYENYKLFINEIKDKR